MSCDSFTLPGGVTGIACSRGRKGKVCRHCTRRGERQCDYPLGGTKAGKTCDAYICAGHATSAGTNLAGEQLDYCPPHAKIAGLAP